MMELIFLFLNFFEIFEWFLNLNCQISKDEPLSVDHFLFFFFFLSPDLVHAILSSGKDLSYGALYSSVKARITLNGYCLKLVWVQACRTHENKTMLCLWLSPLAQCYSINICWKHKRVSVSFFVCLFLFLWPSPSSPRGPVEVERSKVDDSGRAFCHVLDSHSRKTA